MPPKQYTLDIARPARKDILALPPKIRRQAEQAIDRLIAALDQGQRPQDIKPIKGEPDTYRIRVGHYRVLYYLDDKAHILTVLRVQHRKDAYRNL